MTNASELLEGIDDLDLAQMQAIISELAAIADMACAADIEIDGVSAIDRFYDISRIFALDEADWTYRDLADAVNSETARLYRRQVTQLEAQLAEVREALGKVQSYHKGEKPYDFHRLPDDQRQNEAFDAWQVIACEIDALLTKEPK